MFFDHAIRGDRLPRGTVCLTYDDGPGATEGDGPGPRTLELGCYLHQQQIAATFFVIGSHAETHPDVLAPLKAWGHLVGNHTYSHPLLASHALAGGDVVGELQKADRFIRPYLSGSTAFFRVPYGDWREGAWSSEPGGKAPSLVADLLNRSGDFPDYVGPVGWDIDAGDWECWRRGASAEECAGRYLALIELVGRGIVLMHDSSDEVPTRLGNRTMQATKLLIPLLKERGYRFVRLDAVPQVATAVRVRYQVALRASGGGYLSRRGERDGRFSTADTAKEREAFGVIELAEGIVALRAGDGLFLSSSRGHGVVRADALIIGAGETLVLKELGGGEIALCTADGRYLSCGGRWLQVASRCQGPAERFVLQRLFTGPTPRPDPA